ncbi:MAG: hypothetical protein BGO30_08325 [Bacteroidetes bacterium 41-46]|nr:MAG: hypothetical protein BGO30_08325 [Bacteroidetes bacterium 41-46]
MNTEKVEKQSQNDAIAKFLLEGNKITPMDALRKFGCFRLGARVHDLRHKRGLNIKSEYVKEGRKRYASYELAVV